MVLFILNKGNLTEGECRIRICKTNETKSFDGQNEYANYM